MKNVTNWNGVANQYSNIQESRREIVFPFLLDHLRTINPSSLLDYGGGDGHFIKLCSELPISQLYSYDPAIDMVELARETSKNNSRIKIVNDTADILPGSCDVITFNVVWMCLHDWESCLAVLKNINQLLKVGGLFVASVTHPCFRSEKFANYSAHFNMKDYLTNGIKFPVTIHDDHNSFDIVDTHWNLSAMTNQLKETGFLIQELIELPDLQNALSSGNGSPWLIIKAIKPTV